MQLLLKTFSSSLRTIYDGFLCRRNRQLRSKLPMCTIMNTSSKRNNNFLTSYITAMHRPDHYFSLSKFQYNLEDAIVYYAVSWSMVQTQAQPSSAKRKIKKIFLRQLTLSRYLAKTLRVKKIAMKSFSKNLSFEVDFEL